MGGVDVVAVDLYGNRRRARDRHGPRDAPRPVSLIIEWTHCECAPSPTIAIDVFEFILTTLKTECIR